MPEQRILPLEISWLKNKALFNDEITGRVGVCRRGGASEGGVECIQRKRE